MGYPLQFQDTCYSKNGSGGGYLNYVQFIPRLTFYAGMSLGFVYLVSDILHIELESNFVLFTIFAFVELIRLGFTILIHGKF